MAISASDLTDRQRQLLLALFDKTPVDGESPPVGAGVRGRGNTIYGLTTRFNRNSPHALSSAKGWGATMKSLERLGLVKADTHFRGSGASVEAWLISAAGYEMATTTLDFDWVLARIPTTITLRPRLSGLAERREYLRPVLA
jgi:hypothetical protein